MRILHTVEFYEPRKGGAEEVVRQLSQRLVKAGHEVTVATSYDASRTAGYLGGVRVEQFRLSGNSVTGIEGSQSEIKRYQDLLAGDFDVVMNYAAQSWPTDLAFDALYRMTAKKILVPCGYSGLHNPAYAAYFAKLPALLAKYDSLVYMSESYQDKQFGDEHGLGAKAVYIPNGAAAEEFLGDDLYNFKKRHNITTPHIALCVANHYLAKGHRFVIDAFLKMKRTDTTLVIIGKPLVSSGARQIAHLVLDYFRCAGSALLHPKIKLINTDDRAVVVSAYKNADVFLFGSTVECAPLVMYESFASKTPFITRPVGNVADHKDVLKIVESTEEMARVANYILDDRQTSQDIAGRAYAVWQKDHAWDAIAKQYEKMYKENTL